MPDNPLDGLTRRQLEELREQVDRELRSCVIDGREGARAYRISDRGVVASILLCKPCFERIRLPVGRAEAADG